MKNANTLYLIKLLKDKTKQAKGQLKCENYPERGNIWKCKVLG